MRKESSKTRIAHNRDYTELLSRRIRASPIIELSSLETLIKRRRLNKQLATLVSLNVPPFSINATGIYHRRKKKKKKETANHSPLCRSCHAQPPPQAPRNFPFARPPLDTYELRGNGNNNASGDLFFSFLSLYRCIVLRRIKKEEGGRKEKGRKGEGKIFPRTSKRHGKSPRSRVGVFQYLVYFRQRRFHPSGYLAGVHCTHPVTTF